MPLYDTIGLGYASFRRPDPRIAAAIHAALGDAASVVNVGAGAGSYEPSDRAVLAIEPSAEMIKQRPPTAAPCLQGSAEALPLETASADAAMAVLSAHHWSDLERGLRELARVARKRIVLLTWIPDAPHAEPFWLTEDYFPEILAHDRTIFPAIGPLRAMLERVITRQHESTSTATLGATPAASVHITPLPIPQDCIDGFLCAYWRRPECYLSAERRSAISSFTRINADAGVSKLRADLAEGLWTKRHARLLAQDSLDLGYRLVRCEFTAPNA